MEVSIYYSSSEDSSGYRNSYTRNERDFSPTRLRNTVPSDSRTIPGLVQGYAGANNPFGGTDAMITDGRFAINPQFEWTGGGIASTSEDLARWAKALYDGEAFDRSLMPEALDGVPARLGRDVRYGLGIMLRPTTLGMTYGHSGFFRLLTEVMFSRTRKSRSRSGQHERQRSLGGSRRGHHALAQALRASRPPVTVAWRQTLWRSALGVCFFSWKLALSSPIHRPRRIPSGSVPLRQSARSSSPGAAPRGELDARWRSRVAPRRTRANLRLGWFAYLARNCSPKFGSSTTMSPTARI